MATCGSQSNASDDPWLSLKLCRNPASNKQCQQNLCDCHISVWWPSLFQLPRITQSPNHNREQMPPWGISCSLFLEETSNVGHDCCYFCALNIARREWVKRLCVASGTVLQKHSASKNWNLHDLGEWEVAFKNLTTCQSVESRFTSTRHSKTLARLAAWAWKKESWVSVICKSSRWWLMSVRPQLRHWKSSRDLHRSQANKSW